MKQKQVIRLLLALTTAVSMTACSLDFHQTADNLQNLDDTVISQMQEDLGSALDEWDEQSEDSLSHVVDSIKAVADATERVADVEFVQATLVRVVDGDTIVVSIDKEEYKVSDFEKVATESDSLESRKVRLIGINTPESVAPESYHTENSKEGIAASDYVKDMLSDVKTVYLQTDVSDTDQYGRLLRYVWLEVPDNPYDIEEVATKMLNGILVLEKIAEPVIYEPDTAYADYFEELEYR